MIIERDGKPVIGDGGLFHVKYEEWQRTAIPIIDVALLYPTSSDTHAFRDYGTFRDLTAHIRRFVDLELVDERLVQDGALGAKSILIMAGADTLEAGTLAKIGARVEGGGVLFVLDSQPADWDGNRKTFDDLIGLTQETDEIRGITELAVDEPKTLPSIASLPGVFVTRAFIGLAADVRPLLSMRYTSKGKVAWRRRVGKGCVYAYFGPMDLRQREDSWMVAHNLPARFIKDGIQDAARDGILKKLLLSLNLSAPDVYLVETQDGLMALNMSDTPKKVEYPGGAFEIPGHSILKVKKPA